MMTRFGFVLAATTLFTGVVRDSADAQVVQKTTAPLDVVRAVGIKGGRIASVTTGVPAARDTIDVRGLVVAPGFIDLHSHGQDSINYRYSAHDGVTTALELELGTYPVAPWYAKR